MVAATTLASCADGSSAPIAGVGDTTTNENPTTATSSTGTSPGSTSDAPPSAGQQPEGFTTIRAQITDADGDVCEVCLWLADSSDERRRGLMGVTDLGDAAGMVFRFDDPVTTNSFNMLNTPTPLSIAWFLPGGDFTAATDMEPCMDVLRAGCPRYGPGVEYELALEVFRGGLGALGVGLGSSIELIEGSEAERCPATS